MWENSKAAFLQQIRQILTVTLIATATNDEPILAQLTYAGTRHIFWDFSQRTRAAFALTTPGKARRPFEMTDLIAEYLRNSEDSENTFHLIMMWDCTLLPTARARVDETRERFPVCHLVCVQRHSNS